MRAMFAAKNAAQRTKVLAASLSCARAAAGASFLDLQCQRMLPGQPALRMVWSMRVVSVARPQSSRWSLVQTARVEKAGIRAVKGHNLHLQGSRPPADQPPALKHLQPHVGCLDAGPTCPSSRPYICPCERVGPSFRRGLVPSCRAFLLPRFRLLLAALLGVHKVAVLIFLASAV